MLKKMMLLAMAAGALIAFAAPAAMAETTVTNTAGAPAEEITAFSNNLKTTTAVGTLFCNEVDLNAEVDNGATATLTDIQGTAKFNGATECPVLNEKGEVISGATITSITGDASLSGGAGTASFTFKYDITVAPGVEVECGFATSTPQKVTYTGAGVVTIPGAALTGSGPNPPCSATGNLTGALTLDGSIDG